MNDHNLTSSYPEKRLITYPSTRLRGFHVHIAVYANGVVQHILT